MESKWRWIALTAIAPIAWGSTYFVTRAVLPVDVPLWGGVLRALPAGLILLVLSRRLPSGAWWWRSVVLGVLNVGGFFALIYVVGQLLPSSIASTLMATSAAVMMLLAWPLLRQRPRALSAGGAVLGLVGVVLMLAAGGDSFNLWGVAASLVAMLSSSLGFILTARWGAGIPAVSLASWQLLAGALVLLPVALFVEGPPPELTLSSALGFGYLTVVATAVAYVVWFAGLQRLPAGVVGMIGLLNPVAGILLGTAIAGEALGVAQLLGIAMVLGGIAMGAVPARATRSSRAISAHVDFVESRT